MENLLKLLKEHFGDMLGKVQEYKGVVYVDLNLDNGKIAEGELCFSSNRNTFSKYEYIGCYYDNDYEHDNHVWFEFTSIR